MNKSNIILIGMPGAGKSTVGSLLAEKLSKGFLDTDALIEISEGRSLQSIVDSDGYLALRQIEEDILSNIDHTDHVIATGGSAVYSHIAMNHLKNAGTVIFLNVNLSILRKRIGNYDSRGLAIKPDQSFEDLYEERLTLYFKYADIIIDNSHLNLSETCKMIIENTRLLRI